MTGCTYVDAGLGVEDWWVDAGVDPVASYWTGYIPSMLMTLLYRYLRMAWCYRVKNETWAEHDGNESTSIHGQGSLSKGPISRTRAS